MGKKIIFFAILVLALLISGCVETSTETAVEAKEETAQGELREFEMTAKRYEFNPNTITVKEGDTVRIRLTSLDVTHGIKLNEFDVNVKVPPAEPKIIEFVADKAGTFTFKNSVYCGLGCSDMKGTLIVE